MNLDAWLIPLMSLVTFGVWAWATRLSLGLITIGAPPPVAFRLVTLSTLTLVSLALTLSALVYPALIDNTTSRFFAAVARVALLIGGVLAVRELRRAR